MEREVSEVDRKLLLKKTYLDKISYFINRNPISQDELCLTVRRFFTEFLKLDYEFTYEELSQELNKVFIKPKVKERIDVFLLRLSESEYLEENALGTAEINSFLSELAEIIQNVIYDDQSNQEDGSILQKVLKIKPKSSEKLIDVSSVTSSIEEMNFHITNGNLDIAKNLYVELLKNYDTLDRSDKRKLHESMNEVYERLQALIKNPKSKPVATSQSLNTLVKKVTDLIEETTFFINASNVPSAKNSYANTLALYDSLNIEDKKLLHPKVNELYARLQALSSVANLSTTSSSTSSAIVNSGATANRVSEKSSKNTSTDTSTDRFMSGTSANSTPATNDVTSSISSNSSNNRFDNMATAKDNSTIYGAGATSFDFTTDAQDTLGTVNTPNSSNVAYIGASNNESMAQSVSDNVPSLDRTTTSSPKTVTNSRFSQSNVVSNVQPNTQPTIQPIIRPGVVSLSSSGSMSAEPQTFVNKSNTAIGSESSSDQNMLFTSNTTGQEHSNENILSNFSSKLTDVRTSPPAFAPKPVAISVPPSAPLSLANFDDSGINKVQKSVSPEVTLATNNFITSSLDTSLNNSITTPVTTPVVNPIIPQLTLDVDTANNLNSASISTSKDSLTQLDALLKKINEDMLMEKTDKAKNSYNDALSLYKSLSSEDRAKYYDAFYLTFKKLDVLIHRKLLHELLDTHLLGLKNSKRPIASLADYPDGTMSSDSQPNVTLRIKNGTQSDNLLNTKLNEKSAKSSSSSNKKRKQSEASTLPVATIPLVLNNDEEVSNVYELIEEAYFNMDNDTQDLAMLKYFKALDIYHKLSLDDKKKIYPDVYALFKRLSELKNSLELKNPSNLHN